MAISGLAVILGVELVVNVVAVGAVVITIIAVATGARVVIAAGVAAAAVLLRCGRENHPNDIDLLRQCPIQVWISPGKLPQ